MRRILRLVPIVSVLFLTACGGGHHRKSPPVHVACPQGSSFMGCASGAQARSSLSLPPGKAEFGIHAGSRVGVTQPVPGCHFPDVSDWQGHPNWAGAAPYICAGVAKAGEGFSIDPDFGYNITQLRALHIPWSAYWFVRGCNEGNEFNYALGVIGFGGDKLALRPVLDMEVPAAHGCAVPIAVAVHARFGVWPIIYTGPGTWPGGSSGGLDVWEADYSSRLAPLPFAARVLAWQAWAPPYRYYRIPGLAYGDVSVDLRGFVTARAFPKPPPSRGQIARWTRARDASERVYRHRGCPALAQRERWFAARLHGPKTARHRRALAATRAAERSRSCAAFARRIRYFDSRLKGH